MPLHQNNQLLIDTLAGLPLLDGRFANIKLVNWDAVNGQRGCFSLVFRADDVVEGKPVALKFFDLDPRRALDRYRVNAFARESEILQAFLNVDRCLQLEKGLAVLPLPVPGSSPPYELPCQYFAVQWLDNDIDAYFFDKTKNDPADKLRLFNEIVLAVEALHRHRVFHRDLKADNLRASLVALKRVVVAIDLGTAARFDSGYMQTNYASSVGASGYAAAEALCGLAGNRQLAPCTDAYALGCLLFELFNRDFFFRALDSYNRDFGSRLVAMSQVVTDRSSEDKEIEQWSDAIAQFGGGVAGVPIDAPGSSVPPGVAPILNEVLGRLTNIDFAKRPIPLDWVRKRVWAAIRALENERAYQMRLAQVRERRRLKIERAKALDDRLEAARRLGSRKC